MTLDTLQIETANICNNHCIFCPHQKTNNHTIMPMELFKKIIDEAILLKPRRIVPFLNGEPFLDPFIFERLDYIREKLPNTYLEIFTNATTITKPIIEKLKKYNIDFINISVNAANKKTYKKITLNNLYDKVVINTINIIESNISKNVRVSLVPIGMKEIEIEQFKKFWKQYNCEVQINQVYNWHGDFGGHETNTIPCIRILSHMTILADGRVNLCCMDTGDYIIGDVNKQTLMEVWNNNEWMRWMHLQYKRPMVKPCCWCNMK